MVLYHGGRDFDFGPAGVTVVTPRRPKENSYRIFQRFFGGYVTKQHRTAQIVKRVQPVRILLLGLLCVIPVSNTEASLFQETTSPNPVESQSVTGDAGGSMDAETETRNGQTRRRLIHTGIGGFGVVSLLSVLFVYLRLNHATRGFYSRRLQVGASVVALIVLLAVVGLILIVK